MTMNKNYILDILSQNKSTILRSLFIAFYLVLAMFMFQDTISGVVAQWFTDTFSHGPLVILVSFYLIFRKRYVVKSISAQYDFRWLLCVLIIFTFLFGEPSDWSGARAYLVVTLFILVVPLFFGHKMALALLFPLGFLYFAVPFDPFFNNLLMVFTSNFTVNLLQATGIAITKEQFFFGAGGTNWSVGLDGSGLRYLISAVTLASLYAYLSSTRFRTQIIIVLSAGLFAIVLNCIRIWLAIVYSLNFSPVSASFTATQYIGLAVFTVGLLIFGLILNRLLKSEQVDQTTNAGNGSVWLPKDKYSFYIGLLSIPSTIALVYAINTYVIAEDKQIADQYRVYQAQQNLNIGDIDQVIEDMLPSIDLSKGFKDDDLILAVAFIKKKNYKKANEILNQVILDDPENIKAVLLLGYLLDEIKEINKARLQYERVLSLHPANNFALSRLTHLDIFEGKFNDARSRVLFTLKLESANIKAMSLLANVEMSAGNENNALAVIHKIQGLAPQHEIGFILEARVHLIGKNFSEALVSFERAAQYNDSEKLSLMRYALLKEINQDLNPAITFLSAWLAKYPRSATAHKLLAQDLMTVGDDTNAIKHYEANLLNEPASADVLNNLAWLYLKKHDTRALKLSQLAFNLMPESPEVMHTYGQVLIQLGDKSLGLAMLEAANKKDPKNIELHRDLLIAMQLMD